MRVSRFSAGIALSCVLLFGACGDDQAAEPTAVIEGLVVAGPVCPVETDPPDPGCAPRPVPSAEITATNEQTGAEKVAVTDAEGRFRIEIEAGAVQLTGAPVEGLLGVPDPVRIDAVGGGRHVVDLVYDTGIR